ncbi:MAG: fibronectin type III domain-containing protein [Pseudomonadota bacterium]|nr:fibronectin type III domain-containing protein [Pseudomonadota bacterium]
MLTTEGMAVASLSAIAGPTSAILSWTAARPAAGYRVFQNGWPIGTTTQTRFAIAGLQKATGYVFTVAAIDAAGCSVASDPITLLTA